MNTVQKGAPVPSFTAESTHGTIHSKELIGQPFVLYFYPRDNTPGCTNQANDFQAKLADFEQLGVTIIGVSRDTMSAHERFAAKYGLNFALISDPDETLCNLFAVMKEKMMYGRKVRGIERSTFLFNAAGELVEEWRKVRVPGHVDAVFEACQKL